VSTTRFLRRRGQTSPSFFDNPSFFPGDLLQRIAEILAVFEGNIGDDRQERMNNIGGIEPPPHPDLQNGDIHPLPLEMEESHRRQEFKIAHLLPHIFFHPFRTDYRFSAADHLTVDPNPLAKIDQVRRCVHPGPEPAGGEDRSRHRRHRTLAVGSAIRRAG